MEFYIRDSQKECYHQSKDKKGIFIQQNINLLPGDTWNHNHVTYHVDKVEYLHNGSNVYMTKSSS